MCVFITRRVMGVCVFIKLRIKPVAPVAQRYLVTLGHVGT